MIIGIGTDLVDVGRFRETLARTPTLSDRVFTEAERAYASRKDDPTDRLAARFAAKEATLKSLGLGLGAMKMAEIEVVRNGDGRPLLVLHGQAERLAAERGVARWHVSLTHTESCAQATVVAESA